MVAARLLYLFLTILCGFIAYASMRMPSRMDDANFVGVIGAIGAMYGIYKLGETFLSTENHNHDRS